MFSLSLGIMAHNEEANIGRLLQTVLSQQFTHASLKEIIVVASGCTDRTEDVVREFEGKDSRIRLLSQASREGKASAINLFLVHASGDILILESADTVPHEGCLDRLITPFGDPKIGMTGARPIPINRKDNFIGFTVHLLWTLHHKIAMSTPKLGELVAFRNFVREIPKDTAVDEASIDASSPQIGKTGRRYLFKSWSDGQGKNHEITASASNTAYSATFTTQYSLTTSVNIPEGGTVNIMGTDDLCGKRHCSIRGPRGRSLV